MWAHDPWDTRVHSGRELADTVTWSSKHHTDYKLAMTRVFKLSEPTHKWHTSFTKTISPQCTQTVPPAGTRYSNARDAGDVCHKTHRNKVTVLAAFNYRFLYAFNVKKQELGAGLYPWTLSQNKSLWLKLASGIFYHSNSKRQELMDSKMQWARVKRGAQKMGWSTPGASWDPSLVLPPASLLLGSIREEHLLYWAMPCHASSRSHILADYCSRQAYGIVQQPDPLRGRGYTCTDSLRLSPRTHVSEQVCITFRYKCLSDLDHIQLYSAHILLQKWEGLNWLWVHVW